LLGQDLASLIVVPIALCERRRFISARLDVIAVDSSTAEVDETLNSCPTTRAVYAFDRFHHRFEVTNNTLKHRDPDILPQDIPRRRHRPARERADGHQIARTAPASRSRQLPRISSNMESRSRRVEVARYGPAVILAGLRKIADIPDMVAATRRTDRVRNSYDMLLSQLRQSVVVRPRWSYQVTLRIPPLPRQRPKAVGNNLWHPSLDALDHSRNLILHRVSNIHFLF
jgi:hypothetical protein